MCARQGSREPCFFGGGTSKVRADESDDWLRAGRITDAELPSGSLGIPWLEAWWKNEFSFGEEKSFFSESMVNSRRVHSTRRFFTEVLANMVSMKLGGLLLRV